MVISKVSKKQDDFIKGKKEQSSNESRGVLLRVPKILLDEIDRAIEGSFIKPSRNTWFLEAALKYLKETAPST